MTSCAWVVISTALAACASRTPTERERALAKLPSNARVVAAADGVALTPFRPVVDAARPHLPPQLGCVLDAALTSEAVVFAVEPGVGTTIVLTTRAHVASCEALSKIASDTYGATLGGGRIVDDADANEAASASVLTDLRWARARSYLLRDPIAIAAELGDRRVLAVAQPEPIDAWLAIDAADVLAVERAVRQWLDRQRGSVLASLVAGLDVRARGSQLLVNTRTLKADELAHVVADILRMLDAPPATPPLPQDLTHRVGSLAAVLRDLADVPGDAVVAGGDVIGVRIGGKPQAPLVAGDILLALDSYRITSMAQLGGLAHHVRERAALAVRRDGHDIVIVVAE